LTKRNGLFRLLVGTVALAIAAIGTTGAVPASGATAWAPAATAAIHPGVQTFTNGAQCTANFVFTQGSQVFIGQAAHCSGTGSSTDTNGCTSQSLRVGTPVQVTGASRPGVMVYNSWLTMQALHETNPDTCAYNDLAIIALNAADYGKVNPSIPHWGGPVGINTAGATLGQRVYSYGNSELRLGVTQLSPKVGVIIGTAGHGWSHGLVTLSPGIPGDSGSAFLDASGRAIGVLSTVEVTPIPASNNAGDIYRELTYLHGHSTSFAALQLALGTQPFKGSPVP
jgi:hypothetical protein